MGAVKRQSAPSHCAFLGETATGRRQPRGRTSIYLHPNVAAYRVMANAVPAMMLVEIRILVIILAEGSKQKESRVQIDCQREPRIAGWRRIVVIVDDPKTSLRAIQRAVAAARRHQARLTIISVVPRPWATVAFSGMCPRRLEAEATECAAAMVRRLAATVPADVPCTTVVRCGRMIKEIFAAVGKCEQDLVFFALRPGGALRESTSLRRAVCLMRRASVDCVFLSFSPLAPARASASWLGTPDSSEFAFPNWALT